MEAGVRDFLAPRGKAECAPLVCAAFRAAAYPEEEWLTALQQMTEETLAELIAAVENERDAAPAPAPAPVPAPAPAPPPAAAMTRSSSEPEPEPEPTLLLGGAAAAAPLPDPFGLTPQPAAAAALPDPFGLTTAPAPAAALPDPFGLTPAQPAARVTPLEIDAESFQGSFADADLLNMAPPPVVQPPAAGFASVRQHTRLPHRKGL